MHIYIGSLDINYTLLFYAKPKPLSILDFHRIHGTGQQSDFPLKSTMRP